MVSRYSNLDLTALLLVRFLREAGKWTGGLVFRYGNLDRDESALGTSETHLVLADNALDRCCARSARFISTLDFSMDSRRRHIGNRSG